MRKIWVKLKSRYPILIVWEKKAKVFTLPGFDRIPLYDVYKFFVAEIRANSLPMRSKSIAFSFFLAIFPALSFIFTLIPYIPYFRNMDTGILNFLKEVLPNHETYVFIKSFLEPILTDVAKHKRGGVLTGSFFLVFFLMSNGVLAMMSSFNKSHDHYKKRNALENRLEALKITLLLIVLFIFSILLIILGQQFITLLSNHFRIVSKFTHTLLDILRYVLIILLFFFSISLIYYFGPATKKKYRFISAGATVATVLSILISSAFSYYVNNFYRLNVILGSITTIMLLMIWLNINAFVLLIGYEINASIYFNQTSRAKELDAKKQLE